MLISSHIEKIKYKTNARLDKTNKNGLQVNSIVKCDYIYKIPVKNILFKIGQVDIDDYIRFIEIYNDVLDKYSKTA